MSTPEANMAQMMAAARSGTRARVGRVPMGLPSLAAYNPNRPDSTEAIWQPFYDFQAYASAGVTSQTFFQVPQGQAGKTYADTNMQLAGQFPAPTAFLCTAIMVFFDGGATDSTNLTTFAAQTNINDVIAVANSGFLEFTIGGKVYLRDAPLGKFAPNFTVNGFTSIAIAATAPVAVQTGFARAAGRYYEITPFLIPQSQNFNIQLNWPTAQATSTTGRIGVILDGFYYRQSQ